MLYTIYLKGSILFSFADGICACGCWGRKCRFAWFFPFAVRLKGRASGVTSSFIGIDFLWLCMFYCSFALMQKDPRSILLFVLMCFYCPFVLTQKDQKVNSALRRTLRAGKICASGLFSAVLPFADVSFNNRFCACGCWGRKCHFAWFFPFAVRLKGLTWGVASSLIGIDFLLLL